MLTKGVSQRSSLQLARPLEPGEEAGCRRADGLAAQLGELAQQPLLLVVELVRGLYRELDQVVVAPGEDLVGDHVELDVEVAGRAAELAGVAAALVADAHPVVEAGWDVDGQLGVLRDPALALAARARRQHLVAAAAAGHAGAGGDELAEQGLAHGALLAGAVAGPAGGRGGGRASGCACGWRTGRRRRRRRPRRRTFRSRTGRPASAGRRARPPRRRRSAAASPGR